MKSCVLTLPANLRETGNALGEALGHGPASYSVPLSADGQDPATHYGLHTWAGPEFLAMLAGAAEGEMPDIDFPPNDFAAVVGALIASVRDDLTGHFAEVIDAEGLAIIAPPENT